MKSLLGCWLCLFVNVLLLEKGRAFTSFYTGTIPSQPLVKSPTITRTPIPSHREQRSTSLSMTLPISIPTKPDDIIQLSIWITLFATSHIGMSGIREQLIRICGTVASNANLINRGFLQLPKWWPGDDVGKDAIFPDADTAGRQLYRMGYSIVSFVTLGGALASYLSVREHTVGMVPTVTSDSYAVYFAIAAAAGAASLSSLVNASPLSLMPGFQQTATGDVVTDPTTNIVVDASSSSIAGLQRNDALKFEPRGLTRITRHPLILPVVPWGIATAYLAGGAVPDFLFFGGLATYAIAGCACQDLRISKKEGSVGTVFRPSYVAAVAVEEENIKLGVGGVGEGKLETFFAATSLVPFAAVVDGRQSMGLVVTEFPIVAFVLFAPLSAGIEYYLLRWLS